VTAAALDPPFATAPAAAPPRANKWLITLSVTFGTLMGAIDASIVNVAIPHIRGTLGVSVTEVTWIVTGFTISTVIVMPLTAFLGRFFGQKRFYQASLVLFLVGSLLCGFAKSLTSLAIFRAVQGMGAGALQPTEQAILRQTFPPKEQGMAMALFGMAVMLGPAIGPTLGGYIVDQYSWPWIFFINLPVGALGLFMVARFVPEPEDIRQKNRELAEQQRKHFDWQGIALLTVGLAAMQYMLEEGQKEDWWESTTIVACALVAVFGVAAFVLRELSAPVPAVNLRLFKDRVFLSGTLVGAMMFSMLLANVFLLPLFMQELLGFTAVDSGVALMPRTLVMMVATPIVGRVYNSISPRGVVAFGVFLFVLGAYQMSHFTLETSEADVIWTLVIQGVGFACLFVPLTTVALSNIERHKLTDATGLNSLLRQVGGSVGVAVFATLLSRYAVTARGALAAHVDAGRPEVAARWLAAKSAFLARGFDPVSAEQAANQALGGTVAQQALLLAFDKMFLLAGLLFLGILPLLLFLKVDRNKPAVVQSEPMEI
jgi:DHA2 family multidrug resistance protein